MAKITGKIKAIGQKLKKLSTGASKALKRSGMGSLRVSAVKPAVKIRKTVPKTAKILSPAAISPQEAKYFTHPENRIAAKIASDKLCWVKSESKDLPQRYDKDVIVLQVRDPGGCIPIGMSAPALGRG